MNEHRLLALITGAIACTVACGRASRTAPTAASPAIAPLVQPFGVSGTVKEYRGGPLSGVVITARPNVPPGNGLRTAHTDPDGSYRIDGLTEPIIVDAEKAGYFPTGFGAFTGDRVLNFTMTRRLDMGPNQTLTATIWGDSALSGEDDTGSNCGEHSSQGVHSNGCLLIPVTTGSAGTLTARLTWSGVDSEMGVFVSTGLYAGQGAHGSSPVTVSAAVHSITAIVISLERAAGVRPVPPSASQMFELTTSFVPQ
jgi:hypothetical protein